MPASDEDVKSDRLRLWGGHRQQPDGRQSAPEVGDKANLDVRVIHVPVHQIPPDTDVIVTHIGGSSSTATSCLQPTPSP